MKWKNALRDGLPDDSITLLISFQGVYHVAYFRKKERTFEYREFGRMTVLPADNELIYWIITDQKAPKKISFRVLVADDDIDDHVLMKDGLAECTIPVQIDAVYDGIQALDYLLKRNAYEKIEGAPDLVLLDLNMPLVDGFGVLKQIKSHPHLRNIPVYVITTSRDTDQRNRALELGADGFYTKGASRQEMIRIMKEVCVECFETSTAE